MKKQNLKSQNGKMPQAVATPVSRKAVLDGTLQNKGSMVSAMHRNNEDIQDRPDLDEPNRPRTRSAWYAEVVGNSRPWLAKELETIDDETRDNGILFRVVSDESR